jgi:hypothetical protein
VRRLLIKRSKRVGTQDESKLLNALGADCCRACRTDKCEWKQTVDEVACQARIKELKAEIERIRSEPDAEVGVTNIYIYPHIHCLLISPPLLLLLLFPMFPFEYLIELQVWYSMVPLSAQLGGGTAFTRDDLMDELVFEVREIERRIELNNIDKELHDCYATTDEYIQVFHLHGYASILWTINARKALNARQERLVAMNVAQEIADDILEHMLEGWVFGERKSDLPAVGYVPSINPDGFVTPNSKESVHFIDLTLKLAKKRHDENFRDVVTLDSLRGEVEEKLMPILDKNKVKLEDKRIAKEGTEYWHRLNETERTIKFGLFLLTFMYFRAMVFLSKERQDKLKKGEHTGAPLDDSILTDEKKASIVAASKTEARQKKIDLVCSILSSKRVISFLSL